MSVVYFKSTKPTKTLWKDFIYNSYYLHEIIHFDTEHVRYIVIQRLESTICTCLLNL